MGENTNKIDSRDKLEEEISRLETPAYSTTQVSLPKVTLDEIQYTAPSNEAIKIAAENALQQYKQDSVNTIRSNSAATADALAAEREAYINGRDSDSAALKKQYEQSARAIDNDVIKRGLARSSIAASEIGALEREYLSQSAEIAGSYGKKISSIDAEMSSLDSKLQEALNDFNLSYAAKLNEKILELQTERDKKIAEITKFNNDVRKSQAQLDSDRAKDQYDLAASAIKLEQQQSSAAAAANADAVYKAVYEQMDAFLGSLTPQEALLEIRNHSLYRQHLSNYYYNRLYDKYGRGE